MVSGTNGIRPESLRKSQHPGRSEQCGELEEGQFENQIPRKFPPIRSRDIARTDVGFFRFPSRVQSIHALYRSRQDRQTSGRNPRGPIVSNTNRFGERWPVLRIALPFRERHGDSRFGQYVVQRSGISYRMFSPERVPVFFKNGHGRSRVGKLRREKTEKSRR